MIALTMVSVTMLDFLLVLLIQELALWEKKSNASYLLYDFIVVQVLSVSGVFVGMYVPPFE